MLTSYKTVKGDGDHEIVIQKSRFIASVTRAESEAEARDFIESIKKQHKQANHHCFAYLIGDHDQVQKANDDGEPSGTAGVPMLEVLKKQGLKDTAVVITRYFGGIKLGGGGLIRAYSSAVSEVLKSVGIVQRELADIVAVRFDYTLLGKIESEIRSSDFIQKDIEYLDQVVLHAYVPAGKMAAFESWINGLTSGQVKITVKEQAYLEQLL